MMGNGKVQELTQMNWITSSCIEYIEQFGLGEEGIFTKKVDRTAVKKLMSQLENHHEKYDLWIKVRGSQHDVHLVAAVLLAYMRSLTEPLMKFGLYEQWMEACSIEKLALRATRVREALGSLDGVDRTVLKHILKCVHRVHKNKRKNKMSPAKLASVWSAVLLRSSGFGEGSNLDKIRSANEQVITLLVVQFQSLFPDMRKWLGTQEQEEIVGGVAVQVDIDTSQSELGKTGWKQAKKSLDVVLESGGGGIGKDAPHPDKEERARALADTPPEVETEGSGTREAKGPSTLSPPGQNERAKKKAQKSVFDTDKKCFKCLTSMKPILADLKRENSRRIRRVAIKWMAMLALRNCKLEKKIHLISWRSHMMSNVAANAAYADEIRHEFNSWADSGEGKAAAEILTDDPTNTLLKLEWEKQQAQDMASKYKAQLGELNDKLKRAKMEIVQRKQAAVGEAKEMATIKVEFVHQSQELDAWKSRGNAAEDSLDEAMAQFKKERFENEAEREHIYRDKLEKVLLSQVEALKSTKEEAESDKLSALEYLRAELESWAAKDKTDTMKAVNADCLRMMAALKKDNDAETKRMVAQLGDENGEDIARQELDREAAKSIQAAEFEELQRQLQEKLQAAHSAALDEVSQGHRRASSRMCGDHELALAELKRSIDEVHRRDIEKLHRRHDEEIAALKATAEADGLASLALARRALLVREVVLKSAILSHFAKRSVAWGYAALSRNFRESAFHQDVIEAELEASDEIDRLQGELGRAYKIHALNNMSVTGDRFRDHLRRLISGWGASVRRMKYECMLDKEVEDSKRITERICATELASAESTAASRVMETRLRDDQAALELLTMQLADEKELSLGLEAELVDANASLRDLQARREGPIEEGESPSKRGDDGSDDKSIIGIASAASPGFRPREGFLEAVSEALAGMEMPLEQAHAALHSQLEHTPPPPPTGDDTEVKTHHKVGVNMLCSMLWLDLDVTVCLKNWRQACAIAAASDGSVDPVVEESERDAREPRVLADLDAVTRRIVALHAIASQLRNKERMTMTSHFSTVQAPDFNQAYAERLAASREEAATNLARAHASEGNAGRLKQSSSGLEAQIARLEEALSKQQREMEHVMQLDGTEREAALVAQVSEATEKLRVLEGEREEMRFAYEGETVAMQTSIENQMRARGDTGLRQLRQAISRLAKGELGMRIETWRTAIRDEVRDAAMKQMRRDLQAQSATAGASGLRMLRQALARFAKGETGMRMEVWRSGARVAARALLIKVQGGTEAQLATGHGPETGLRLLRQMIARLIKGEIGMRVAMWRINVRDSARSFCMAKLEADLEAKSMAQSESGLRQLRQIMARMVKGELGMRVEIWRMAARADAHTTHLGMQEAMNASSHPGQAAGLRQLRQITAQLLRGELGLRITVWRGGAAAATRQRAVRTTAWEAEIERLTGLLAADGGEREGMMSSQLAEAKDEIIELKESIEIIKAHAEREAEADRRRSLAAGMLRGAIHSLRGDPKCNAFQTMEAKHTAYQGKTKTAVAKMRRVALHCTGKATGIALLHLKASHHAAKEEAAATEIAKLREALAVRVVEADVGGNWNAVSIKGNFASPDRDELAVDLASPKEGAMANLAHQGNSTIASLKKETKKLEEASAAEVKQALVISSVSNDAALIEIYTRGANEGEALVKQNEALKKHAADLESQLTENMLTESMLTADSSSEVETLKRNLAIAEEALEKSQAWGVTIVEQPDAVHQVGSEKMLTRLLDENRVLKHRARSASSGCALGAEEEDDIQIKHVESLREQIATARSEIAGKDAEIERMRLAHEQIGDGPLTSDAGELRSLLAAALAKLAAADGKILQLTHGLETSHAKYTASQAFGAQLMTRSEVAESSVSTMSDELVARTALVEEVKRNSHKDLALVSENIAARDAAIEAIRKDLVAMAETVTRRDGEIAANKDALARAREETTRSDHQVKRNIADVNTMMQNITARDTTITDLRDSLTTATEEVHARQATIHRLQEALAQLQQDVEAMATANHAEREALLASQLASEATKQRILEAESTQLKVALKTTQVQYEHAKASLTEAAQRAEGMSITIDDLSKALEGNRVDIGALEAELRQCRASIEAEKAQRTAAEGFCSELKRNVVASISEKEALETELAILQQSEDAVVTQLSGESARAREFEGRLRWFEDEMGMVKSSHDAVSRQCSDYELEVKRLTSDMADGSLVAEAKGRHAEALQDLERELVSARADHDKSKSKANSAEAAAVVMSSELSGRDVEISKLQAALSTFERGGESGLSLYELEMQVRQLSLALKASRRQCQKLEDSVERLCPSATAESLRKRSTVNVELGVDSSRKFLAEDSTWSSTSGSILEEKVSQKTFQRRLLGLQLVRITQIVFQEIWERAASRSAIQSMRNRFESAFTFWHTRGTRQVSSRVLRALWAWWRDRAYARCFYTMRQTCQQETTFSRTVSAQRSSARLTSSNMLRRCLFCFQRDTSLRHLRTAMMALRLHYRQTKAIGGLVSSKQRMRRYISLCKRGFETETRGTRWLRRIFGRGLERYAKKVLITMIQTWKQGMEDYASALWAMHWIWRSQRADARAFRRLRAGMESDWGNGPGRSFELEFTTASGLKALHTGFQKGRARCMMKTLQRAMRTRVLRHAVHRFWNHARDFIRAHKLHRQKHLIASSGIEEAPEGSQLEVLMAELAFWEQESEGVFLNVDLQTSATSRTNR